MPKKCSPARSPPVATLHPPARLEAAGSSPRSTHLPESVLTVTEHPGINTGDLREATEEAG
jgi:hypothetical protein